MMKQHVRNQSRSTKYKEKDPNFVLRRLAEGSFILVLILALFILLSLISYRASDPGFFHAGDHSKVIANSGGLLGAYIADTLYFVFGYLAYILPACIAFVVWVILCDYRELHGVSRPVLLFRSMGFVLLCIGGCGLLNLSVSPYAVQGYFGAGGIIGSWVGSSLNMMFNAEGSILILIGMILAGVTWCTFVSWLQVIEVTGCYTLILFNFVSNGISYIIKLAFGNLLDQDQQVVEVEEKVRFINTNDKPIESVKPSRLNVIPKIGPLKTITSEKEVQKVESVASIVPKSIDPPKMKTVSGLPSLKLLEKGVPGKPMGGFTHQELETLSREVEQHLRDFGVHADVVAVHPGPVITRFELQLAAGVKVSKLSALAIDLARSLSVKSVRVVELIPGKTVVGIELPNVNRAMVKLSDVLSSEAYQQSLSPLSMALGVDISGNPMIVDLGKMPHLLVAGTTGSGKSVGINAMILSLLFKASPELVRLIMIDPKMLELSVYDGIPHLLTPVVTDMKEASSALRWCVGEMERRYRLMSMLGVRNLAGYNTKVVEAADNGQPLIDPTWKSLHEDDSGAPLLEPLPYIVVIIDELADMMMVVGKKVEQLIARIAQKARAAGIHLILATQRPSVDVLTGLIKSNIPTRISFQVSSKIDSRTILDQQGAEQLLGHGDMLFLAPGTGAPLRVHGAFVDDSEVHRVANDWRTRGKPEYIGEILATSSDLEMGIDDESDSTEEVDKLYDQAVAFVVQTRRASVSSVQRRFKIGYNRAARLVEEMERNGLVGPLEGSSRDVLVPSHEE